MNLYVSFENVERHMKTKHPETLKTREDEL